MQLGLVFYEVIWGLDCARTLKDGKHPLVACLHCRGAELDGIIMRSRGVRVACGTMLLAAWFGRHVIVTICRGMGVAVAVLYINAGECVCWS